MGFFGSRTRTVVGTSVIRAIEDKNLPDAIKTSLLEALLSDGDIAEYAIDGMFQGMNSRVDRAYIEAQRDYPFGMPSSVAVSARMGEPEAKVILEAIEGQSIDIIYSNIAVANSMHFAWEALVERYEYNAETNELPTLSASKGYPVYLYNLVPTIPNNYENRKLNFEALEFWGISPLAGYTPSRVAIPSMLIEQPIPLVDGNGDTLKLTIEWNEAPADKPKDIKKEVITLPAKTFNESADYIHVKYEVSGVTKYWSYALGSGTFPTLDNLLVLPYEPLGTFMPYIYFRHEARSLLDSPESEEYKASKKMAKLLGMDYDQMAEAIEENPDIADVQQAVMMFIVPVNTENEIEIKYLYEFFEKVYELQPTPESFLPWEDLGEEYRSTGSRARNAIVIQDKLFEFSLRHKGAFKRYVRGTLNSKYEKERQTKTYQETIDTGDTQSTFTRRYSVHVFKHQITKGVYEEIVVREPSSLFKVFGDRYSLGDEDDDNLIVPLDRSIVETYAYRDKEILYGRSLHYVFNSMQVIKVRWYETGFFSFLVTAVGLILSVWTAGQSLALSIAAAATSTALAVIVAVLKKLLIGLLIQQAFTLFVQIVGEELGLLIAVLAALAGAYQYIKHSGVANAPWAQELLSLSSSMSSGVQNVTSAGLVDLQEEMSAFSREVEESTKLLDNARELLENTSPISPFVIFGESPTNFYNRTIHSGNTGVKTIEAVTEYVQVALRLPEISDTLGESYGY